MLLARVTLCRSSFMVLVAHGLLSFYGSDATKAWWWRLSLMVDESRSGGLPLVVLAGCSGRLGIVHSPFVGPFAGAVEDCAGGTFHSLLAEQALFVPSTFEAFSTSDDTWTWRSAASAGSKLHRIFWCVFQVWPALGARESLQHCGGLRPPHF